MKNYFTPELNITAFEAEDVMNTLSNGDRGIDMAEFFDD